MMLHPTGRASGAALVLAMLPAAMACHHRQADPEPAVDYAEITSAPPYDLETYPYVIYEARPVYFYGGRWWYRDRGGAWTHYRVEPEALRQQRAHLRRLPPERRARPGELR
jgi:hypothetical protein